MTHHTCLVAQAGGPTSVINRSLYGVISEAKACGQFDAIWGGLHGVDGVIAGRCVDLGTLSDEELEQLKRTPGAALGGCRTQIKSEQEALRVVQALQQRRVGCFFYIGGNDSMDTAKKVHEAAQTLGYALQVVGIPKTVDNDVTHTDHTPGYGSAAKYVATSVLEAGLHAASMVGYEPITLCETVGRHTGWLPGASALARRQEGDAPHLIYLPETPFVWEQFFEQVENVYRRWGHAFIVCGEGLRDRQGDYITAAGAAGRVNDVALDDFGHPLLGGVSHVLADALQQRLQLKTRAIKLDICQQSALHCSSAVDAQEAEAVGRRAVRAALDGQGGHMVAFKRCGDHPYCCELSLVALAKVANAERYVPPEWIDDKKHSVRTAFLDFVRPLIQGRVNVPLHEGLPRYVNWLSTFERRLKALPPRP